MLRNRGVPLLALAVAMATACEQTPVDPTGGSMDLTAVLFGDEAAALTGVPMSLPALVQSAIFKVYNEQGAQAARTMVMDLRRLQEQARTADSSGNRELAATRQRALHAEQISMVLNVFGGDVAGHVIEAVRADLTLLEDRLPDVAHNGRDGAVDRARDLLAQVRELLTDAEVAAESGARRAGLDAATRAAAMTESVRHAFAESLRLPGLDDLLGSARHSLRETARTEATRALFDDVERLRLAAQDAVRTGDRQRAHAALAAVRSAQIRIVLQVLGPAVVRDMLDGATASAAALKTDIAAVRHSGRDVTRLERMLSSARDMLLQAETAFADGDSAGALDLGSHAVGLINALRLAAGSG
jgi:hypothetical protein